MPLGIVATCVLGLEEILEEELRSLGAEELKREMEQQQVRLDLRRLYQKLDYSTYGGAPLLGVNGVVVIAHGGSSPQAIRNGIGVAVSAVERRMVEHIATRLGQVAETSEQR